VSERLTLQRAAERAGIPFETFRKAAQRGHIRTVREGERVLVESDDLDLYLATQKLKEAIPLAQTDTERFIRDVGNAIARMPTQIQQGILEGIGHGKVQASPEPARRAMKAFPKTQEAPPHEVDDPHFGNPVGYRHSSRPAWKRISASTWRLGDATWSWNGLGWEGGGSAAGRALGDGISPASPYADQRPMTSSEPVPR
jgi:excisionase family DNA binding protein